MQRKYYVLIFDFFLDKSICTEATPNLQVVGTELFLKPNKRYERFVNLQKMSIPWNIRLRLTEKWMVRNRSTTQFCFFLDWGRSVLLGDFLEIVSFVLFRGDFYFRLSTLFIRHFHFGQISKLFVIVFVMYWIKDLNGTKKNTPSYIKISRSSVLPFSKSMEPIFFCQATNCRCSVVG